MTEYQTKYNNILKLLRTGDKVNMDLAMSLLVATRDIRLVKKFFKEGAPFSSFLYYHMVPLWQEHSEFWKEVKPKLDRYRASNIQKWINRRIIPLWKERTLSNKRFYLFANTIATENYGNFPKLSDAVIENRQEYYCASISTGSKIEDGIGWELEITEQDVGPAEVIHQEKFIAIAHHPNFNTKICIELGYSEYAKGWAEKIHPKS